MLPFVFLGPRRRPKYRSQKAANALGMIVFMGGTTTPRLAGAQTLATPTTVRLLFDAPVTQVASRDEQRLWVVSRGRLFELDLCVDGPREIRLDRRSESRRDETGERGHPRRFQGDAEEALMLASLDEATLDDIVLEDFLDDEDLSSKGSVGTRRRTHERSPRQEVVDLKRDHDGDLWVMTSAGRDRAGLAFRCEIATASCSSGGGREPAEPFDAPRLPRPALPAPASASDKASEPGELTEETGPLVESYEVPEGAWLSSSRGVWFALRDPAARSARCAYVTESRGSGDDLRAGSSALPSAHVPPRSPPPWSLFLPRVSLVAAHATRAPGKSESLLLVLLAFSPGRAVSRGAAPLTPFWSTPASFPAEPLP